MQPEIVEIKVYDKRQKISTNIWVEQLSGNIYKTLENELFFNCRLTLGTEFETFLNKDGKHEIVRIVKDSPFITKQFLLSDEFRRSEFQLLCDEIIKQGGYWQVEFGGIITINLPKDCSLSLNEIFKTFNFSPVKIKD